MYPKELKAGYQRDGCTPYSEQYYSQKPRCRKQFKSSLIYTYTHTHTHTHTHKEVLVVLERKEILTHALKCMNLEKMPSEMSQSVTER